MFRVSGRRRPVTTRLLPARIGSHHGEVPAKESDDKSEPLAVRVGEIMVRDYGTAIHIDTMNVYPGLGPSPSPAAGLPEQFGEHAPEYVFVAHANADKLLVMKLCRGLLARGVRPWLDIWDLAPEPKWEAKLNDALTRAPMVIVCEGPHGSGLQQGEYSQTLRNRIQASLSATLWVRLPGASSTSPVVPAGLRVIQVDEANWSADVDALASQIGTSLDGTRWPSLEAESSGVSENALEPYRGLESFAECHARWMFGRDEDIASLLAMTEKHALVTVVGASGSGKSSLVKAGLCAALRNGALGGRRVSAIGYLRPDKHPCAELALALLKLSPTSAFTAASLRNDLLQSADTLSLFIRQYVANLDDRPRRKVVLVVDQLEELFTEARLGQKDESPEAMPFVRNIIEATKNDAPLWVVTTLRVDFLAACMEVAELARTLNSGVRFSPALMREDQIRDVVELPARRVGFEVELRLIEKFVGVAEQVGVLPHLQFILRQLWQYRDEQRRMLVHSAYDSIGGLKGAIAMAAERALEDLGTQLGERASLVTQRVMMRLIRVGVGTQGDTRKRARRDEFGHDDETRQVLDVLIRKERVLVSNRVDGAEVVEIVQEALLWEWPRLAGWIDANRNVARLQEDIALNAANYEGTNAEHYLWPRGRIEEARRIFEESTLELNDKERTFLEASEARIAGEEQREADEQRSLEEEKLARGRLNRNLAIAAFMVLASVSAIVSWLAIENQRQAVDNQLQSDKNLEQADKNAELAQREQQARESAEFAAAAQKGMNSSLKMSQGVNIDSAITAIEAAGYRGAEHLDDAPPEANEALLLAARVGIPYVYATLETQTSEFMQMKYSPDGSRLATLSPREDYAELWDTTKGGLIAQLVGHDDDVEDMAFSSNGELIATASRDTTARVWRSEDAVPLLELRGHKGSVDAIALLSEDATIVTASDNGWVKYWDMGTGELMDSFKLPANSTFWWFMFSDDGRFLAATTQFEPDIWVVDIKARAIASILSADTQPYVHRWAFSESGAFLAASNREMVNVWVASSGRNVLSFKNYTGEVADMRFATIAHLAIVDDHDRMVLWNLAVGSPIKTYWSSNAFAISSRGDRLVTGSRHSMNLWEALDEQPIAQFDREGGDIHAMLFSPSGDHLAVANENATIDLWDVSYQSAARSDDFIVEDLAISSDGKYLASTGLSSDGSSLVLRDFPSGRYVSSISKEVESFPESVQRLAFSSDGHTMFTLHHNNVVRSWATTKLWADAHLTSFEVHTNANEIDKIQESDFSCRGAYLATVIEAEPGAWAWTVNSGEVHHLHGHTKTVTRLLFDDTEEKLVTISEDAAHVWHPRSGTRISALERHEGIPFGYSFSPDSSLLVMGSQTGEVRTWNVETGDIVAQFDAAPDEIIDEIVFSPDGSTLAVLGTKAMHFWHTNGERAPLELGGLSGRIYELAYSPSGEYIVTAGEDGRILAWKADSGRLMGKLDDYSDTTRLQFSPDGQYVIAAGGFRTGLGLWPMPQTALALVCERISHSTRFSEVEDICRRD